MVQNRGYYKDIENYFKEHKKARLALSMAKDLNLQDEYFQELIDQMIEMKKEKVQLKLENKEI